MNEYKAVHHSFIYKSIKLEPAYKGECIEAWVNKLYEKTLLETISDLESVS